MLPYSLLQALYLSPPDYQQGEYVRIMYVHVPSAWMALIIYCLLAVCSLIYLIWQVPLAYIIAIAIAPTGAMFSLLTLITGSIWGYNIWNTWWVWDARLTSMLILFMFYVCYLIVVKIDTHYFRLARPASAIALIGVLNVPIIKFSVNLWNTLHQPASVVRLNGPALHYKILIPLMLMFMIFILYFIIITLLKIEIELAKAKNDRYNL